MPVRNVMGVPFHEPEGWAISEVRFDHEPGGVLRAEVAYLCLDNCIMPFHEPCGSAFSMDSNPHAIGRPRR